MKITGSQVILVASSLALVIGLPVLGHWHRRDAPPRCAFDGLPIEPCYRVVVIRSRDVEHTFCCVRCADRWLEQPKTFASEVFVTDETTGDQINASTAWFVRSSVATNHLNGNRIHVFRLRVDAERHADAFHGEILSDSERPFRKQPLD